MPFWGNSFSIFGVTKSMLFAFIAFKSHISSFISFGVMSFMGSTDCAGDSRYSSIASSVPCACGWNTSARCFANTVFFLCRFLPIFLEFVSLSVKEEMLV